MALTKIPANMLSGVDLGDSVRVNLGTDNDLALFHTGGNGVIHNTTGELRIRANNLKLQDYTNEDLMIVATSDGSVDLYHNNQKKFETTSTGASVTGNLAVSGNLTVSGTTAELDTTNLNVTDKNITLNYHASSDTSSNADGAGITIQDAVNSSTDATLNWSAANDRFKLSHGLEVLTGNVGIGTTTPSGILSIPATDTTTKPQIRFMTTGATNLADAALSTTDDSGGTNLLIGSNQYYSGGNIARFTTSRSGSAIDFGYTGKMKFFTGSGNAAPTESMQISALGTVLVGKIAEGTDTDGIELNRQDVIVATRNGDSPLILNRRTSDGDIAVFRKDNTVVGSIGAYNSATAILSGSAGSYSGLYLNTNKIEPVGNNFGSEIRANNTIDIGSSTYKFKDLYLSGVAYATQIDITESTNARMYSSDAIGEVGSGTFALQVVNAAGSALKPLGFRAEDIRFATGSAERMRIDSSGNIGIGLTPETDWHTGYDAIQIGESSAFFANAAADEIFMVQNARYTSSGWKYNSSGTAALFDMQSGNTRWRRAVSGSDNGTVSWSDSMIILGTNGNVGIGVTDPNTNLEVNIQGAADGNGIHITSTATNNDPALKISRNGGAADVFSMRPRGGAGAAYFAIAPDTILDSGINMKATGFIGLGGNVSPISTLHMYGSNTADVASNGAGINGLHLSRTSSKGENIYVYMTDGNAAASSWAGIGNVGKIESFGNNAFEIGSQQDVPVVLGQNNTQKLRIKGDITAHAKFGVTYVESLYTPNGGVQNCRIFEDYLGKWVAVGYFAADAKSSIQTTFGSARGAPTGLGQSETTVFSADWGDSYPTEVRYLGATDFNNFQETKTIDFIHGVPRGRPWKQFFNNAHRIPDGGTSVSSSLMGSVQGPVGSVKNGWECRGAYDGRGRWHNPSYTHHRMSDNTSINCADTAFTTPTSSHFNWEAASDAKISVHHSLDYSGQDGITSAAFGNDDNINAFFDDYPTDRTNFGSTANNYTSAVYVLMKLPEMQSIGLEGGRARGHQPGEVVQTKVYERNADVSATSGLTGEFGSLDFTPLYGNSLIEFNIHANTGTNSSGTVVWKIYQGSSSAVGTLIRRTGNQIVAAYDQAADGHPLPFSWTQYYQLNDDKKSTYRYRIQFSPSGATYWGHTYGSAAHSYFTIKEIKQEHDAKGVTD